MTKEQFDKIVKSQEPERKKLKNQIRQKYNSIVNFLRNTCEMKISYEKAEEIFEKMFINILDVKSNYSLWELISSDWEVQLITNRTMKNKRYDDNVEQFFTLCYKYSNIRKSYFEQLLDSEPVEYNEDIVITDPCYIFKNWPNEDFTKCYKNNHFNKYESMIFRSNLIGDGDFTTYNSKTKQKIGTYCADTGLVCVDTLEHVLTINPEFSKSEEYIRTIIKNFKGIIWFEVVGETYEKAYLTIRGKGTKDGKEFEFYAI